MIAFEDVQHAISDHHTVLVSTLPRSDQQCVISGTLSPQEEEARLNASLSKGRPSERIVVYGRNAQDKTPEKKCKQLSGLGFTHVLLYPGGMFEWTLLQDIYGMSNFPTTRACADPLVFKGAPSGLLRLTA